VPLLQSLLFQIAKGNRVQRYPVCAFSTCSFLLGS
jgi:hypothetical protein